MEANQYYEYIRAAFEAIENEEYAAQQSAYMKNHFAFFGIKAPVWQAMLKDIFKQNGVLQGEELRVFIESCFEDDCREMQYAAIEMAQKAIKKESETFIEVLVYMISKKSWWDSVDWIAKLVGMHFKRFPHQIVPVTAQWMDSDMLWLQRVAIIFQLHYKEKTDMELLFKYIVRLSASKEFFIQKASGWALRDLSRRFPEQIVAFVEAHPELSALTKREALRLL
jgi:3-methyladenine DNA glycosylase AlkD